MFDFKIFKIPAESSDTPRAELNPSHQGFPRRHKRPSEHSAPTGCSQVFGCDETAFCKRKAGTCCCASAAPTTVNSLRWPAYFLLRLMLLLQLLSRKVLKASKSCKQAMWYSHLQVSFTPNMKSGLLAQWAIRQISVCVPSSPHCLPPPAFEKSKSSSEAHEWERERETETERERERQRDRERETERDRETERQSPAVRCWKPWNCVCFSPLPLSLRPGCAIDLVFIFCLVIYCGMAELLVLWFCLTTYACLSKNGVYP